MALELSDYAVEVSSDAMEAQLSMRLAPGQSVSEEELRAAIVRQGVVRGIDEDTLARLVRRQCEAEGLVIARGRLPLDGEAEEITYHFPVGEQLRYSEDEHGAIDLRSLRNFNNCRKGDLLAEKSTAGSGSEGFDVRGRSLAPRSGTPAKLSAGKGALLTDDGRRIVAEVDGHVCLQDGAVRVHDRVEIPTDLDYGVGNVNFVGSVIVRGSVMPGFRLEADGDIRVDGNVEKAELRCGGNLEIRGIVFGRGECRIEVEGDASIGAADQAELRVRGNLSLAGYLRNSEVLVGGSIELTGPKGNIVGGRVSAQRGLKAPYAGNPMAALTRINVGSNPFLGEILGQLELKRIGLATRQQQLNGGIRAAQQRVNSVEHNERAREMLAQLAQALAQLQTELRQVEERIEEVQMKNQPDGTARIRISEKAFPGVVVSFRDNLQYKTMDTVQAVCFYEQDGEVRTGPL